MGWFFIPVASIFYGVIAAGQILATARLYYSWLVLPLSILLSSIAILIYLRFGQDFLHSFNDHLEDKRNRWLEAAFLVGGIGVYILLVIYPLVHWPFSPITAELPWDAGLYHFPKAIEMIVTHSSWDLSISYGEYPFGYESLIALAFLLNRTGFLIGTVHALISLFLLLGMWMLVIRRTKTPTAPVLLILGLLFLSQQMARNFDSNAWWMFWPQITLIGKNDALLAAALLAVLLHVPFSRNGPFFPFGLAITSMIALSIKPNAALVVLFAWLVMLFFIWQAKQIQMFWKQLAWSVVIMAPGVLWILRNLIVQGTMISSDALQISEWSIASNLTNPFFYTHIPRLLYIVLGVILVSMVVSVFKRSLRFDVLVASILLVTFAMTPATAFFGSTQVPTQVGWRFALALMAYFLILLLSLFETIVLFFYRQLSQRAILAGLTGLLVLALSIWSIWEQRDLMATYPEREIVLHDQYSLPVGVDGYYSAYDYVQKNVHNSVVIIENGLPFYLYDPGFTNSVTRSRPPDYFVWLQTPWLNQGGYPDLLNQSEWTKTWVLVYEDTQGRVYKRK
jgi:hypothetical protein